MDFDACFQLGYVIKSHGLKGEVSVFFDTDLPHNYKKLESVFVAKHKNLVPFFIDQIQVDGNKATIKFEGINNVDAANELKGEELWLPLELLPELGENEFYFHDIIGFVVEDDHHGLIGTVKSVYTEGSQNLVAVDVNGTEVLVPLVDDIIHTVDTKGQKIFMNLPDGLLEVYQNSVDED